MSREQFIRSLLFYISLSVFLLGLPFLLSFSLGYKFNPKTMKFTKTGIIAIKTQPQGASIYLDSKLLNEKTPASINELLPGEYNITLELEKHYSWNAKVKVEAGKVSRLDKVILFPLRPNIKQLNKDKISFFWVDTEKSRIYYINHQENILYSSNLEGEGFKDLGSLPLNLYFPVKCKLSADRQKLLCFNNRQIAIIGFQQDRLSLAPNTAVFFNYQDVKVIDVFWHSDNYHVIVITDKNIEVREACSDVSAVSIVNLDKKNISYSYDEKNDTLYFVDSQRASDGEYYDNAYRLDLSTRTFPLYNLESKVANSFKSRILKEDK